MQLTRNQASGFNLDHIGWKYFNTIKKKAVEQEFSWSGLLISLSIAFFIVIISAACLNFINQAIASDTNNQEMFNKIYYLERTIQTNLAFTYNYNI